MSRIVHVRHNGSEYTVELWDGVTTPSIVKQRIPLPATRGHPSRFYLRKVLNPARAALVIQKAREENPPN